MERVARVRKRPITYSPAIGPVSKKSSIADREVDYSLNKNRAAQKKVDAADRPSVNIINKHENVILELSAGAYECFRSEFLRFYEGNAERICIPVHQKKEKSGLITEHSYSIKLRSEGEGTARGSQFCRVSMYHTSCRVMVNGRRYGDFLTHDLIRIVDLMEGNSDLKEINNRIRSACQMYLTEGVSPPGDNGARIGSKKKLMNGPSTREPICDGGDLMIGSDGTFRPKRNFNSGGGLAVEGPLATDCQSPDRVSTCLHCDEVCGAEGGSQEGENSIYCDSCETWMHWSCEGLSDEEGSSWGNSDTDYKCSLCTSNGNCSVIVLGDGQESMLDTGGPSTPSVIVGDGSSTPTAMVGDGVEAASLSVDLHNNFGLLPIAEDPGIQSSDVDFHVLKGDLQNNQGLSPIANGPGSQSGGADTHVSSNARVVPELGVPSGTIRGFQGCPDKADSVGARPKIPYRASAGRAPEKSVGSCAKLIIPSSGATCNGEDINKDILEGGSVRVDTEEGEGGGLYINTALQTLEQDVACVVKNKKASKKSQQNQVSVSDGLTDINVKNLEKMKNKQFKSREQDLQKREQECNDMIKQLAAIKSKVIQQEHLITELENSKKILETQLILTKRVDLDSTKQSADVPVSSGVPLSGQHLVESKMLFLEQRMYMLEMDCLRMKQDAIRTEQLRALESQQNILLRSQEELMNLSSRRPDPGLYEQHQRLGLGAHASQFPYINRVQVPVIDQGLGYHAQVPAQIMVNESGLGPREHRPVYSCAPQVVRANEPTVQDSDLHVGGFSAGHSSEQTNVTPNGPIPADVSEQTQARRDADTVHPPSTPNNDNEDKEVDAGAEGTAGVELSKGGGLDPVQQLPLTNSGNVQGLNTEPKDQERPAPSGLSLNNPSFLWQGSAVAKPPWTQSRVMPGQALAGHQVPLQTTMGHQQSVYRSVPIPQYRVMQLPRCNLTPVQPHQGQLYFPQGLQHLTSRTFTPINYTWINY